MATDSGLLLTWTSKGRNGSGTLTAKIGETAIHIDTGNIAKADFRTKFVKAVCKNRPGIPKAEVEAELVRLAADIANKAEGSQDNGEPETGEFPIVRPERFIHRCVSGLTAAERAIVDGRPTGRWALYLQWDDGRRERLELPPCLELPDGSRLWIHPQPSEPLPTTSPGWSLAGRQAWLEGAAAPNAADLFKRLCERIAFFIDLPAEKAPGIVALLGLWVILSYVYPTFDAIPYLYVGGPLASGKSRIFEILSRLIFRPLTTSNLTAACLFRTLHNQGGALLLDEAERLGASTPDVRDILSMLLAGYKRGGKATRLETVGDTFKTTEFEVYGPKAVACISGLPPALASRCITITMFRSPPGSAKSKHRIDADTQAWQALRDDLHALTMEHGRVWQELPQRADVCPDMSGRHFELWQPLLALASWIESAGADGLTEIVQRHALECIESSRDDQLPDADEILLRIVADKVRFGVAFSPGDLLATAKEEDCATFQNWRPRTVSNRLRQYGLPPARRSTHGRRVFDGVTLEHMRRIQQNYRIDLSIASPSALSSPKPDERPETPLVNEKSGDASDASDEAKGVLL